MRKLMTWLGMIVNIVYLLAISIFFVLLFKDHAMAIYQTGDRMELLDVVVTYLSIAWMGYFILRLILDKDELNKIPYRYYLEDNLNRAGLYTTLSDSLITITFPSDKHWLPLIHRNMIKTNLSGINFMDRVGNIVVRANVSLETYTVAYFRDKTANASFINYRTWMRITFGLYGYKLWLKYFGGLPFKYLTQVQKNIIESIWEDRVELAWKSLLQRYQYEDNDEVIQIGKMKLHWTEFKEVSQYLLLDGLSQGLQDISLTNPVTKLYVDSFIKDINEV